MKLDEKENDCEFYEEDTDDESDGRVSVESDLTVDLNEQKMETYLRKHDLAQKGKSTFGFSEKVGYLSSLINGLESTKEIKKALTDSLNLAKRIEDKNGFFTIGYQKKADNIIKAIHNLVMALRISDSPDKPKNLSDVLNYGKSKDLSLKLALLQGRKIGKSTEGTELVNSIEHGFNT